MLPLDTSITNTENALNFQHYQVLNLEQTNRLLSRVKLAEYFKNEAFSVIGLNPQRMGATIAQQQTATEIEQVTSASYAQTEQYFIQHSDNLMPRVHQMRTDLAQYYNSKKPSLRLQYVTQADEKVNFQLNGTDLLLRDFNIFCTTKTNSRNIMEQLKSLALNNNTSGASIYDLGNVIKAESIAELTGVLKKSEEKVLAQRQSEQEHEKQMQDQMLASQEKQLQEARQFEAEQNDLDRRAKLTSDEIRAAGMADKGKDNNANGQQDFMDSLKYIEGQKNFQDTMNLKREQEVNKNSTNAQKLQLEREKMLTQKEIAEKNLQVARENKNKYDSKKK
jgi:hypothetical protein